MTVLRVGDPGPLTLVQDLGRPHRAADGVAASGAADREAHRLAQRLVGNLDGAAGLEVLLGGLRLVATGPAVVAVTGARCTVLLDGVPQGQDRALAVPAGGTLALRSVTGGVRTYLAVRGGLGVTPVLGSRSRDTLGGVGPPPVAAGDDLPVLRPARPSRAAWFEAVPVRPVGDRVGVLRGPHADALDAATWRAVQAAVLRVGQAVDRVGVRLDPPERLRDRLAGAAGDLPSFPVLPGCIQLTPDGALVVLGPDAGVTGGYPVVAVAEPAGRDVLAQVRPGDALRLRPVYPTLPRTR